MTHGSPSSKKYTHSPGIDIRMVQETPGHSQLSQTQRYTHDEHGQSRDPAAAIAGSCLHRPQARHT
jgi:hypothetical protein